ncbi:MAG: phage portal protein, partial [Staphylococcus epidermidis]|nr:phage portal protein [Staphylococcus epidermidis]
YMSAGGEISQQTLMSLVSFIDIPQDEVKRIQSEEEEKVKRSDDLMYKNVQNEENNIEQSTSNIEE